MDSGLFQAVGGLGLFLLGMVVMTNGLKSMAGDAIRRTIARFTRSPLSGVAAGAAVTALIQSSSATTVAAVGFAGAGLLNLSEALGIIFGANIGTTITGWIVAVFGFKLKLGTISLPVVLAGVLIHMLTRGKWSAFGLVVAGFGLVFVGMDSLQAGMAGLTDLVTPETFPPDTLTGRLLIVLVGVAITMVTQSSSAGVAMALAAVHSGTISFPQAAVLVIGFNVGTTVTAAIAAMGGGIEARRVALAHVIYNVLTGVGAFVLLTPFVRAIDAIIPGGTAGNPELALVGFHTLFNVFGVLAFLPFTRPFARLIESLIPERSDELLRRLDRSLYEQPSIAIVAAYATLTEIMQTMLESMQRDLKAPKQVHRTNYAYMRSVLDRVALFLQAIHLPADDETMLARMRSLFLAIDHLRRLSFRCGESQRVESIGGSLLLSEYADRVNEQIEYVCEGLNTTLSKSHQRAAKSLYKRFAATHDGDRKSVSESLARGDIDPAEAITQLDGLRWMRRISYHLWRGVRHLRRADFDSESKEEDAAKITNMEAERRSATSPDTPEGP